MELLKALESLVCNEKAFDRLLKHGLPQSSDERYAKVPLSKLKLSALTKATPTVSNAPQSIECLSLSQARKTYATLFRKNESASLERETDFLSLVTFSICEEGLFVYIPPSLALLEPLDIFFEASSHNRCVIFIGEGSSATVKLHFASSTQLWGNSVVEAFLEKNASLYMLESTPQGLSCPSTRAYRVRQKAKSHSKIFFCSFGGSLERQDMYCSLEGEGAHASVTGLKILSQTRHSHVHINMHHRAVGCFSRQLVKQILKDNARAGFFGSIFVEKEAQKTDAFQRNNNLLLDPQCFVDSKPRLQIYADDVKASHGATVGALCPDELFYLQTRGLPLTLAKLFLTKAFAQEAIDTCPIAGEKEMLSSLLHGIL